MDWVVHDPPHWRQKQIGGPCCRIWAQSPGGDYIVVIGPALMARQIDKIAGPAVIAALLAIAWKRRSNAPACIKDSR